MRSNGSVHWVDIIPWILNDPIARVNAEFHWAEETDVEAGAVLQFETRDGTYHTGYYLSDRGKDTHLGVYGTDAQVRTPSRTSRLPLEITSEDSDWTDAPMRTIEFEFTYDRFPAWVDFVQDYFEAYFEGYETGDVPATVDDAVQLLRVLDAAYESGERGGWVEVMD